MRAELIVGFGRIDGRSVGVVANNPMQKGGVLFVDSADKAARFMWLCDAFNVPLLFLADVPGFMVGTAVERQGIIRHGAKMITAVTEATVPKVCVIVRKAYGAGLYAMCGPAFDPIADARLADREDRGDGSRSRRSTPCTRTRSPRSRTKPSGRRSSPSDAAEYEEDVDLLRLASELVVDAVVDFDRLRDEIVRRFAASDGRERFLVEKRHGVPPV